MVHVHSQHLEYQGWFESRGDSNLTFPWVIENLRNDYDNGNAAKTKYIEQNTPSALAAKQQRKVTKFKIFVENVHQHKGGIQSLFSFLILNTTPPILPGAVRSVCSSSTSENNREVITSSNSNLYFQGAFSMALPSSLFSFVMPIVFPGNSKSRFLQ